ncbi:MAG TPA: MFS transporter [Acidimicrobiia bacterium]|nr:MFS transporter [Acidimicrobiia bacterium]
MSADPRFLEPTPFSRLMVAHAASVCADACVAASLAGSLFFAQPTNAARGDILLYLLLTMAPFAVVAPIMGPALDRIKGGRRLMVVATCLVRALLCLAMAQFIIEPSPEGLLIYPLAFGVLVSQKTYSVARAALVPALVDDQNELVRANSRLAIISLIASMVGGGPAFLLQTVFDARWSLVLAMIVFVVATVVSTRIPRTQVVQDPAEERLEAQELHQPSILLAGSAMAVIRVAVGTIVFLSAFSFKDDKFALGVVLGAYAVGGFTGNLLAPWARRHAREEVILVICLLTAAAFVLFGALTGGNVGGASLAAIAVAIASSAGRVGFDSLLQRDGPDAVRGRAFARFETRFQVAWVLGALFGVMPLGEDVGLLVLGFVLLAAGLSYLAALRSARTRPQRTKLRPEAVDRAFDKAKGELRDRYRRNRDVRRTARGTTPRPPSDRARGGGRPSAPPPGSSSGPQARRVESDEPPQAFPGGS